MIFSDQIPGKQFVFIKTDSSKKNNTIQVLNSGFIRCCSKPFIKENLESLKVLLQFDNSNALEAVELKKVKSKILVEHVLIDVTKATHRVPGLIFVSPFGKFNTDAAYVKLFGSKQIEKISKSKISPFKFRKDKRNNKDYNSEQLEDFRSWLRIQKTKLLLFQGPYTLPCCFMDMYSFESKCKKSVTLVENDMFKKKVKVKDQQCDVHEIDPSLNQLEFKMTENELDQMMTGIAPKTYTSRSCQQSYREPVNPLSWELPLWMKEQSHYDDVFNSLHNKEKHTRSLSISNSPGLSQIKKDNRFCKDWKNGIFRYISTTGSMDRELALGDESERFYEQLIKKIVNQNFRDDLNESEGSMVSTRTMTPGQKTKENMHIQQSSSSCQQFTVDRQHSLHCFCKSTLNKPCSTHQSSDFKVLEKLPTNHETNVKIQCVPVCQSSEVRITEQPTSKHLSNLKVSERPHSVYEQFKVSENCPFNIPPRLPNKSTNRKNNSFSVHNDSIADVYNGKTKLVFDYDLEDEEEATNNGKCDPMKSNCEDIAEFTSENQSHYHPGNISRKQEICNSMENDQSNVFSRKNETMSSSSNLSCSSVGTSVSFKQISKSHNISSNFVNDVKNFDGCNIDVSESVTHIKPPVNDSTSTNNTETQAELLQFDHTETQTELLQFDHTGSQTELLQFDHAGSQTELLRFDHAGSQTDIKIVEKIVTHMGNQTEKDLLDAPVENKANQTENFKEVKNLIDTGIQTESLKVLQKSFIDIAIQCETQESDVADLRKNTDLEIANDSNSQTEKIVSTYEVYKKKETLINGAIPFQTMEGVMSSLESKTSKAKFNYKTLKLLKFCRKTQEYAVISSLQTYLLENIEDFYFQSLDTKKSESFFYKCLSLVHNLPPSLNRNAVPHFDDITNRKWKSCYQKIHSFIDSILKLASSFKSLEEITEVWLSTSNGQNFSDKKVLKKVVDFSLSEKAVPDFTAVTENNQHLQAKLGNSLKNTKSRMLISSLTNETFTKDGEKKVTVKKQRGSTNRSRSNKNNLKSQSHVIMQPAKNHVQNVLNNHVNSFSRDYEKTLMDPLFDVLPFQLNPMNNIPPLFPTQHYMYDESTNNIANNHDSKSSSQSNNGLPLLNYQPHNNLQATLNFPGAECNKNFVHSYLGEDPISSFDFDNIPLNVGGELNETSNIVATTNQLHPSDAAEIVKDSIRSHSNAESQARAIADPRKRIPAVIRSDTSTRRSSTSSLCNNTNELKEPKSLSIPFNNTVVSYNETRTLIKPEIINDKKSSTKVEADVAHHSVALSLKSSQQFTKDSMQTPFYNMSVSSEQEVTKTSMSHTTHPQPIAIISKECQMITDSMQFSSHNESLNSKNLMKQSKRFLENYPLHTSHPLNTSHRPSQRLADYIKKNMMNYCSHEENFLMNVFANNKTRSSIEETRSSKMPVELTPYSFHKTKANKDEASLHIDGNSYRIGDKSYHGTEKTKCVEVSLDTVLSRSETEEDEIQHENLGIESTRKNIKDVIPCETIDAASTNKRVIQQLEKTNNESSHEGFVRSLNRVAEDKFCYDTNSATIAEGKLNYNSGILPTKDPRTVQQIDFSVHNTKMSNQHKPYKETTIFTEPPSITNLNNTVTRSSVTTAKEKVERRKFGISRFIKVVIDKNHLSKHFVEKIGFTRYIKVTDLISSSIRPSSKKAKTDVNTKMKIHFPNDISTFYLPPSTALLPLKRKEICREDYTKDWKKKRNMVQPSGVRSRSLLMNQHQKEESRSLSKDAASIFDKSSIITSSQSISALGQPVKASVIKENSEASRKHENKLSVERIIVSRHHDIMQPTKGVSDGSFNSIVTNVVTHISKASKTSNQLSSPIVTHQSLSKGNCLTSTSSVSACTETIPNTHFFQETPTPTNSQSSGNSSEILTRKKSCFQCTTPDNNPSQAHVFNRKFQRDFNSILTTTYPVQTISEDLMTARCSMQTNDKDITRTNKEAVGLYAHPQSSDLGALSSGKKPLSNQNFDTTMEKTELFTPNTRISNQQQSVIQKNIQSTSATPTSQTLVKAQMLSSSSTSQTLAKAQILSSSSTSQTLAKAQILSSSSTSQTLAKAQMLSSSSTSQTLAKTQILSSSSTSQTLAKAQILSSSSISQTLAKTQMLFSSSTSQTMAKAQILSSSSTSQTLAKAQMLSSSSTSQTLAKAQILSSSSTSQTLAKAQMLSSSSISQTLAKAQMLSSSSTSHEPLNTILKTSTLPVLHSETTISMQTLLTPALESFAKEQSLSNSMLQTVTKVQNIPTLSLGTITETQPLFSNAMSNTSILQTSTLPTKNDFQMNVSKPSWLSKSSQMSFSMNTSTISQSPTAESISHASQPSFSNNYFVPKETVSDVTQQSIMECTVKTESVDKYSTNHFCQKESIHHPTHRTFCSEVLSRNMQTYSANSPSNMQINERATPQNNVDKKDSNCRKQILIRLNRSGMDKNGLSQGVIANKKVLLEDIKKLLSISPPSSKNQLFFISSKASATKSTVQPSQAECVFQSSESHSLNSNFVNRQVQTISNLKQQSECDTKYGTKKIAATEVTDALSSNLSLLANQADLRMKTKQDQSPSILPTIATSNLPKNMPVQSVKFRTIVNASSPSKSILRDKEVYESSMDKNNALPDCVDQFSKCVHTSYQKSFKNFSKILMSSPATNATVLNSNARLYDNSCQVENVSFCNNDYGKSYFLRVPEMRKVGSLKRKPSDLPTFNIKPATPNSQVEIHPSKYAKLSSFPGTRDLSILLNPVCEEKIRSLTNRSTFPPSNLPKPAVTLSSVTNHSTDISPVKVMISDICKPAYSHITVSTNHSKQMFLNIPNSSSQSKPVSIAISSNNTNSVFSPESISTNVKMSPAHTTSSSNCIKLNSHHVSVTANEIKSDHPLSASISEIEQLQLSTTFKESNQGYEEIQETKQNQLNKDKKKFKKKRCWFPKDNEVDLVSIFGMYDGVNENRNNIKPREITFADTNYKPAEIVKLKKRKACSKQYLQSAMCIDLPHLPMCIDCRDSNDDGNYCRFTLFRKLVQQENGSAQVAGFCNPRDAENTDLKIWIYQPSDIPVVDVDSCKYILHHIGLQFCQLVMQEMEAAGVSHPQLDKCNVKWKRPVPKAREMCDICATTIFNTHWTCSQCGLGVCLDCFKAVSEGDKESMSNSDWPVCDDDVDHIPNELMLTQTIPKNVLGELLRQMLTVCKQIDLKFIQLDMLGADKESNEKLLERFDTFIAKQTGKPLSMQEHMESERNIFESYIDLELPDLPETCEWFCDSSMLHFNNPDLTDDEAKWFQVEWNKGKPLLVCNCHNRINKRLWKPSAFQKDFGHEKSDIVNCYDGKIIEKFPLWQFWKGFDCIESRPVMKNQHTTGLLKLKDWPPGADFKDKMPDRFTDLMQALPAPRYTKRTGVLNLAARLPDFFAIPDLGPKMYNAYGSASFPKCGTTNLHLDVSDATNLLVYVGIPDHPSVGPKETQDAFRIVDAACCESTRNRIRLDGVIPGALWHIFPAQSAEKIRRFLRKVASERRIEMKEDSDPIHDQAFYLDEDLLTRLAEEENVKGYAICQCLGDAVFIPAGAPHQVLNLHSCIKVAEDFVAPEHVSHCFQLTQEFRRLSNFHTNHEDKLQIKNIIYHSVKDCLGVLKDYYALK